MEIKIGIETINSEKVSNSCVYPFCVKGEGCKKFDFCPKIKKYRKCDYTYKKNSFRCLKCEHNLMCEIDRRDAKIVARKLVRLAEMAELLAKM